MINEFIVRKGIISLGGITLPLTGVSSEYSIGYDDFFIEASGTINLTLPTAIGVKGKLYAMKNVGDGIVTVKTTLNQTIDGVTGKTLSNNESLEVASDNSNWIILVNTISGSTEMLFAPHSGLMYSGDTKSGQTIYNTALNPSTVSPEKVGGFPAGTTVESISGFTLVQIVDELLFPTVGPTYTIPTLNLSSSVTGQYEAGITVNPNLGLTGTKNDAGAFSYLSILRNINGGGDVLIGSTSSPTIGSTSDIPSQYGYADPNNPNYTYSFSISDPNIIIPQPSSSSSSYINYIGNSSYGAGLVKKNNKGVDDTRPYAVRSSSAPQSASATLSAGVTINGWFPYFYGKSSTKVSASQVVSIIESGSNFTKVVGSGAGQLYLNFSAVGQWCWFAIYEPFETKTIWYETPLNTGNIGTSTTDLFSAPTILSVNSPDGYWNGINFKIYVCQKVTTIGTCRVS